MHNKTLNRSITSIPSFVKVQNLHTTIYDDITSDFKRFYLTHAWMTIFLFKMWIEFLKTVLSCFFVCMSRMSCFLSQEHVVVVWMDNSIKKVTFSLLSNLWHKTMFVLPFLNSKNRPNYITFNETCYNRYFCL